MVKKRGKIQIQAIIQILILIVGIFAFCFIINESSLVGAVKGKATIKRLQKDIEEIKKQLAERGTEESATPIPSGYGGSVEATKEILKYDIKKTFRLTSGVEIDPSIAIIEKSEEGVIIKQSGKAYILNEKELTKAINDGAIKVVKPESQSLLPKLFGVAKGTFMDAALTGVQWAGGAYLLGRMIGSFTGMDKQKQKALSSALATGSFTWKFLATNKEIKTLTKFTESFPGGAFGAGLAVSIITFALLYKRESKKIVTFTCEPWQPPTGSIGGNDCEKCNSELHSCSEYRCKSLGQACQLLNPGTENEKCDWVNPRDTTSPKISVWEDVLTEGYRYEPDKTIRPPARGVKIIGEKTKDGCIKAFTPLKFGILTDEPAQCKIDYNHTLKFDNMNFWFGETNLFLYNHSQKLSLPSPDSINAAAPELKNDGTYTLYVRCKDANGNENVDEFAIRFCVEKGPDTTPPKIEGTNVANNMPIKFNQSTLELEVYVNEPAECRWSREDRSYENMEYEMSCSENVWEMNNNLVYTCKTTLTGIKSRQENKFYFRCKDQPWANESKRNVNMQSYPFTIIGTETLNIIEVKPNGTIKGATDVVSVNLEVETSNGYKNGEAICYYSETGNEGDWIEFYETGSSLHKQRLDLKKGKYKYYIKCVDLGGNRDDNFTEFNIEIDKEAPIIVRAYEEDELLKIVTNEKSECRYSSQDCNFKFEDGIDMPYANQTEHFAEWKTDNTYYIRCSDEYGNIPLSNECSMIIRPYDIIKQKE